MGARRHGAHADQRTMQLRRRPLELALLLALGCSGGSLPPPLIAELLDAHNAVRAAALPTPSPALPPLVWSDQAAALAQSWANSCQFGHNPNLGNFGENIGAAAPADS